MKATICILLSIVLGGYHSYGQEVAYEPEPLRPLLQLEMNCLMGSFGLQYEHPLDGQWTIGVETGLGFNYFLEIDPTDQENRYRFWEETDLNLITAVEIKNIYNRNKLFEKGESLANNTGHYVSVRLGYANGGTSLSDYPLNNAILSEVRWGAQWPDRCWGRLTNGFYVGLGYAVAPGAGSGVLYPVIDATLGLLLIK
ncbi:MAG: hypothetical protein AAF944_22615 [Bacteroidota bacterium]